MDGATRRERDGDDRWSELEELRAVLHRRLLYRCRDGHEADDVVQEALLRAARYRAGLARPGNLRSWVMRIAGNVLRDHVRRSARSPGTVLDDELLEDVQGREAAPGTVDADAGYRIEGLWIDHDVAVQHLAAAFAELAERDRQVLASYYGGEGSCARTSEECGVPPSLVKVRLFRARRRLEHRVRRRVLAQRTEDLLEGRT